jgi:hypothetical protein
MTDDRMMMYDKFSDKVAHYQISSDHQGFPESNFCKWSSLRSVRAKNVKTPCHQNSGSFGSKDFHRNFGGIFEWALTSLFFPSIFPTNFLCSKGALHVLAWWERERGRGGREWRAKNLIYHLFSLFHITDYSKSMFGSYLKLIL